MMDSMSSGCFVWRRENFLAILHAAFNEDGQGRSGHHPMAVARHALKPGARGSGRRQQMGAFEISSAKAHPFHHRQEELGTARTTERESSGFFFVDVLSQHMAD